MGTDQNFPGKEMGNRLLQQHRQFQIEEIRGCCLREENLMQFKDERANERVLEVVKTWSSLEC